MSWSLKEKADRLLSQETGTIRKDWGGRVAFALVYPNTYAVGMSNLGFQTIYRHLNELPDVVCERVFLPDPEDLPEYQRTGTGPFSLESKRPLAQFDLVGFSITYEGDYINTLRLLRMAGIPLRPEDRQPEDPIVLMGGVCAFANPEPVAPFMDFVVVGEGEEIVGEIVAAYREAFGTVPLAARRRDDLLDRLAPVPGIYVPQRYAVSYQDDGTIAEVRPEPGVPAIVTKRRLKKVDDFRTMSLLRTPNAEYGHLALLEVGKGCGRGCRFCLEGQIYRPVRHRSLETLRETVREIKKDSNRVGLVGACVSDYPWIGGLMKVLEEEGLEVSISSIRADSLTEELVSSLRRGGHRTLTVAPEAGTERLRHVIRKDISDAQIYEACELVRAHGIPNLKCYFMIGLPTETDEDIEAIPDLATRLLERLRVPSGAGRAVRPADAVDQLLRAEAVDAVPVGRVRSGEPAGGQAPDHQGRGPPPPQRARPPREPARGVPPGAPGPRGPPGRGLPRGGRAPRGRLADGAPRVERRCRVLHAPRASAGRGAAVGPPRRRRAEGRPGPRAPARGAVAGACTGQLTAAEGEP